MQSPRRRFGRPRTRGRVPGIHTLDIRQGAGRSLSYGATDRRSIQSHVMRAAAFLIAAAIGLSGIASSQGAEDASPRDPGLAQDDRCGPPPMKQMSCLTGTWVCRCQASGQVCDWELVGCFSRPGSPLPEDVIRPTIEPTWPFPRNGGSR
jgi:hypothetical protein